MRLNIPTDRASALSWLASTRAKFWAEHLWQWVIRACFNSRCISPAVDEVQPGVRTCVPARGTSACGCEAAFVKCARRTLVLELMEGHVPERFLVQMYWEFRSQGEVTAGKYWPSWAPACLVCAALQLDKLFVLGFGYGTLSRMSAWFSDDLKNWKTSSGVFKFRVIEIWKGSLEVVWSSLLLTAGLISRLVNCLVNSLFCVFDTVLIIFFKLHFLRFLIASFDVFISVE